MTLSEIKKHLQDGAIIEQEFYPKRTYQTLVSGSISQRLTSIQWDKIRGQLYQFKSDFGVITTHYYKLKQQ